MFKFITWIIAAFLLLSAGSLSSADWTRLSVAKPAVEEVDWKKIPTRRTSVVSFLENDAIKDVRLETKVIDSTTSLAADCSSKNDITIRVLANGKQFDQLLEEVGALGRELRECHVRKVELVNTQTKATRGYVPRWPMDGTTELRVDLLNFAGVLAKDGKANAKPDATRIKLLSALMHDLEFECRRDPASPHLRLAWGAVSLELSGNAQPQIESLNRIVETSKDKDYVRLAKQFKEILSYAQLPSIDKKKADNLVQFLKSNTCNNVFAKKLELRIWELGGENKKAKELRSEMNNDSIICIRDMAFMVVINIFAIVIAAAAIRYERLKKEQEALQEPPTRAHVARWIGCLILGTLTGSLLIFLFHIYWADSDVASRSDAVLAYTHPIKAALEMAVGYTLFFAPFLAWSQLLVGKVYNDEFLQLIKLRISTITFTTKRLIGIGLGLGALDWATTSTLSIAALWLGFPDGSSTGTEAIIFGTQSTMAISISVLTACILAPIFEEAIFRGLFYAWLRRSWPMIPAMVVTSIIFALAHLDFGLVPILTRATIGIISAYGYEKTKSILPGVIAHSLHNSMCCLMMLI